MFQYRQVLLRMRQGDSDRDIARSGLMGRPKVAAFRLLATMQRWLSPDTALPDDAAIAAVLSAPRRASSTISSVEPFRTQVERWAAQGVGGVAIHAALRREHGFRGSYSAVRRMLAEIHAGATPSATVRLSFAPGDAAQLDFGAGPFLFDPQHQQMRRTWAFVMTLCFSRHQYVEFVFDQSVPSWLGLHRRAFEWFAQVPRRLIIAITPSAQSPAPACATPWCNAHMRSADLNAQARRWVLEEAGVRIHGTTRERPLDLFALEKPLMLALPAIAPDLGTWHQLILHRDCHVKFNYSLYSAPFDLIGQTLWLRATDHTVSIFQDYRLVAAHLRCRAPGGRRTLSDHLPPEARSFFAHDRQWCVQQAGKIGASCQALIEQLLGDRILERLRSAQNILHLAATFGDARLEAACTRALSHASKPTYRTVKTILAGGFDRLPLPNSRTDSDFVYGRNTRFQRNAQTLFAFDLDVDETTTRH